MGDFIILRPSIYVEAKRNRWRRRSKRLAMVQIRVWGTGIGSFWLIAFSGAAGVLQGSFGLAAHALLQVSQGNWVPRGAGKLVSLLEMAPL